MRHCVTLVVSTLALTFAAICAADDAKPVNLLIITGDEAHDWKAQTKALEEFLPKGGKIHVTVTTTPAKDLTPENLAKYDVLLLNFRETKPTPETKWSDANKQALLDAVKGGKGLVVFHYTSSSWPNWTEFETMIGGGWRAQGFHGPGHQFTVKKTAVDHPISRGLPAEFHHDVVDELYSNSVMVPGNTVLATAYSDPAKPKGTGKDEAIVWVRTYGKGRVYHNVLGHTAQAMSDPVYQEWMRRGVLWAATGEVK